MDSSKNWAKGEEKKMGEELALVLDCGSTSITVAAVDARGRIVKSASRPNSTSPHPGGKEGWRIWDLDAFWRRLCEVCQEVCAQVDRSTIKAVTVTTFGADGAPMRRDGSLTYPIISWQDERTVPLVEAFDRYMDPWKVFQITGYQIIHFNTLLKMIWLRENEPWALDEADFWLMMPGILSFKLCGEASIDPTSGGTMMAMDMGRRDWSKEMLSLAGVGPEFFPQWSESGEVIGTVTRKASEETGLPSGVPVVATGHDTQFAAVGSGAKPGEAILSSGTWEILMFRVEEFKPNRFGFEEGLLYECDALKGLWDPQLLMIASAVLEWIREHFYGDVKDRREAYARMMAEAEGVRPGANGVMLLPSFVSDTGPARKFHTKGTILGLEVDTTRAEIYRAALEGLSFQLRHALEILSKATGQEVRGIRVVGGGSRNALWNQIRADVTGLPVMVMAEHEATVIGAALFAFVGAGVFNSIDEALSATVTGEQVVEPSRQREVYDSLYERYLSLLPSLQPFYQTS